MTTIHMNLLLTMSKQNKRREREFLPDILHSKIGVHLIHSPTKNYKTLLELD